MSLAFCEAIVAAPVTQRIGVLAGIAFLTVGLIQVAVVMLPMQLGAPEWELAAFGELSGSFGSAAIGVAILGCFALGGRGIGLPAAAMGGAIFFGIVTVLGLLTIGLNLPMVFQTTASEVPGAAEFRVAVVKMLLLTAVYLMLFFTQTFILITARKRHNG
jgi:hypothetical protein